MSDRSRKIVDDAGIEMTPAEIALQDDLSDAVGRVSDARAAQLLARSVIRTAELRWTPDLVKLRLSQAARAIERYVSRPGPSQKTGFWPEMIIEFSDLVGRSPEPMIGGDAREISRIEEAIAWPARYLGADQFEPERMTLQIWLWCKAKDESFGRFGTAQCGSRSTAYRRRDHAILIIHEGLMTDGVLP